MRTNSNLKGKTISGLIWSFVELVAKDGTQFLIQVVLARLLLPEHFGLIGMILVFIAISNSIIDSGFSQALIREKNASQTDYSTIFYFNILISFIIYIILYVLAPTISRFFSEPELVLILRVLSISIIINSFALIPRTMLVKDINFKLQMKINISASISSGVISVCLALSGLGVWSLVFRTLSMNIIQTILLLITKRWKPSLVFSRNSFRRLFGFGWKLLVSGLIDTVFKNIYSLIIGKQYTSSQLGYYTNASKLSDTVVQTITLAIQKVTYPVLSNIQDNEEKLRYSYRKLIKLTAFMLFPVIIGLASIGDFVVNIIFGDKWLPMVGYFQLLCFAAMFYPIHVINLNILKVKGKSDTFLFITIQKKIILFVLILFAVWSKVGILGLIGVAIIDSFISLFINAYYSGKEIEYSARRQLLDLLPIFLMAMGMGTIVYFSSSFLPESTIIKIIVQPIIGVFVYIIGCKIFKIKELDLIYNLLVPFFKKILRN